MDVTVLVRDETPAGRSLGEQHLSLPDRLTLRELIRHRVREEVARYNLERGSTFFGLVQPTDAEATLNRYRLRSPRSVNWERQADIALTGFAKNAFFVLVGDRQVEALDDEVQLYEMDGIAFVRLGPNWARCHWVRPSKGALTRSCGPGRSCSCRPTPPPPARARITRPRCSAMP